MENDRFIYNLSKKIIDLSISVLKSRLRSLSLQQCVGLQPLLIPWY